MDVTKVAKLALQFSQTLPDGHEKKEQLVTMATHWTTNHQRNPMTLNAMNDARGIQAILAPLKKEREAQEKAAAEEILAQEKAIEDAKLAQEKTVEDMKIANEAGLHPENITVPEETTQGSI